MYALNFIISNIVQVGIVGIIILFQAELRSFLEKVGGESIKGISLKKDSSELNRVSESIGIIADAVYELSAEKTGALIIIERGTKLGDVIKTGTVVNADMSAYLIRNIFFNKSPLHDGAMIIRDCRIHAAGCFLPLSQNEAIIKTLGTRHRAAIGMSENSDAAVVVVSEETGTVSVAVDGHLIRGLTKGDLISRLQSLLIGDDDKGQESGVQKTIESIGKILPLPKKDKSSEAGSDGKKSGKGKGKDKSKRGEG
jgi:diadenylate cyclase